MVGTQQMIGRVPAVDKLVTAHLQHGIVDVGQHHPAGIANDVGKARCQITGATGKVEYGIAAPHAAQLDGEALPQPVDTA